MGMGKIQKVHTEPNLFLMLASSTAWLILTITVALATSEKGCDSLQYHLFNNNIGQNFNVAFLCFVNYQVLGLNNKILILGLNIFC